MTVQIGQCGNQLGESFFDTIFQQIRNNAVIYGGERDASCIGNNATYAYFREQKRSIAEEFGFGSPGSRRRAGGLRQAHGFFRRQPLRARAVLVDMEAKVRTRANFMRNAFLQLTLMRGAALQPTIAQALRNHSHAHISYLR